MRYAPSPLLPFLLLAFPAVILALWQLWHKYAALAKGLQAATAVAVAVAVAVAAVAAPAHEFPTTIALTLFWD